MAEETLNQLHAQIDAIRREAFTEGYAAAMKKVQDLAARSVPQQSDKRARPNGAESAEGVTEQAQRLQEPEPSQAAIPLRTRNPVRRSPAKRRAVGRAASDKRRSRGGSG